MANLANGSTQDVIWGYDVHSIDLVADEIIAWTYLHDHVLQKIVFIAK